MAGLLQTGTLVDGQWITTNVDINTVLDRHMERKQEELQSDLDKTPVLGLLTQTVVESPIINLVLPARIRGIDNHDIVFIGDKYVQVRRLGNDGQLHTVAKKSDFGSRIRNACVIETSHLDPFATNEPSPFPRIKDENGDTQMVDIYGHRVLPPQYILLALESGILISFYARNVGAEVEFVVADPHKVSRTLSSGHPGKHLVVDPSSRYMAIAGSENSFSVYALHSRQVLIRQCLDGESFSPIMSSSDIRVKGVIYKMEFLFPSFGDPDHIILLLLAVKNATTSTFVFEWVAGQDLNEIRSNNTIGHILPAECRIPLLLIPLTIQSAFLLVSAESITECHGLLEGSPRYRYIKLAHSTPSFIRLGQRPALWTAWARPLRTRSYSKSHDDIYIAREDGFISFLEIDSDASIQSQNEAGNLMRNIGPAFTSLEVAFPGNNGGDFLVVGGDSSNGGVYLVAARQAPQLVEPIINWSPALDFVTTTRVGNAVNVSKDEVVMPKRRHVVLDEPEKIFACTGRGLHGAISELRYGYEARLRLDVEGLHDPVSDTWVLPVSLHDKWGSGTELPIALLFLFSLAEQSLLLHLTADATNIEEVAQTSTWLDLTSRTLAAAAFNGLIVQITERSISVSTDLPLLYSGDDRPEVYREKYDSEKTLVAAVLYENEFALIVHRDNDGDLHLSVLCIEMENIKSATASDRTDLQESMIKVLGTSLPLPDYPNSLSIFKQNDGTIYGIICTTLGSSNQASDLSKGTDLRSLSTIFRLDNEQGLVKVLSTGVNWHFDQLLCDDPAQEACVSIVNLRGLESDPGKPELLLSGYRNGLLVMRYCQMTPGGTLRDTKTSHYPIGSTSVTFKVDPAIPNVALVLCDSKLWRITFDCNSEADPALHRVWFTDVEDPLHLQPTVDHVSIMPQGLLILSGRRLLATWLDPKPKPIPKKILLQGSSNRVIYSERLKLLIAATYSKGKSSFSFVIPESGDHIDQHCDPQGNLKEYPHLLGNVGEKILCLAEWKSKDDSLEKGLLIVGTSEGLLIVYELDRLDQAQIRSKVWSSENLRAPIVAVATCPTSLFISVGQSLRWISFNENRKIETRAEYQLPSRAASISMDGHWLNVLTVKHSLITFLLVDRKKHSQVGEQHGQLIVQYSDEFERSGLDQVLMTNEYQDQIGKDSALVMVADKDCSVIGLWYAKKAQSLARSHETVFEAELTSSILRFRLGRTRPPWDETWRRSKATWQPNRPDLLGIGIDGSITHFTVLEEKLLRVLRFLQDLVHRSNNVTHGLNHPGHLSHQQDPRRRHVDGEILKPYLSHPRLEKLLMVESMRPGIGADNPVVQEFCSLVTDVYNGENNLLGQSTDQTLESCLQGAYRLLSVLLRPVI